MLLLRRLIQISDQKKFRIFGVHLFLWLLVILYTVLGAVVFQNIEGKRTIQSSKIVELDNATDSKHRAKILKSIGIGLIQELESIGIKDEQELRKILGLFAKLAEPTSLESSDFENLGADSADWEWSFGSAVMFTFTVITTIGYGDISPKSGWGKVFCTFYAFVGIPLAMLAIADLGKFLTDGLIWLVNHVFNRRKANESGELRWKSPTVLIAFLICAILTAALLPLWEDLNFLDALYFSFVTLTTIGFGDIVPRRSDFLLPTLLLIAIGLALTTMTVEVMAEVFFKVHYLGAKLKNVRESVIRFGGKKLTVGDLLKAVAVDFGISPADLEKLDLEQLVETAIIEKEEGPTSPRKPETPIPSSVSDPPPNKPIEPEDFQDIGIEISDIAFMDSDDDQLSLQMSAI